MLYEVITTPGKDLSGFRDPDLGFGDRLAHGIEVDVAFAMDAGNAGDLGLPIDLLEIHPHRGEELEDVGAEGRTPGGGGAYAEEAKPVLKGPEHEVVGQPVLQFEKRTRMPRITSYNVCYTKLLRHRRALHPPRP